jgi:hypothetical protein
MRRLRVADFAALALLYWTIFFFVCSFGLRYELIRIDKVISRRRKTYFAAVEVLK